MFCSRCGTEVQQGGKFCPSCGLDLAAPTAGGGNAATQQQPAEQTEFDVVRDALKDEYELITELGRGGMAIVYRARERELDREVAVKVLPFSLAFDKDFVERFQREARTAAKLEHPHIIPIYRVGRNDRVIYFVMKFLRGQSLSDVIRKRGALPPAEIRKLLSETSHALHYAHQNGIVHRDIKPDNIMLDELNRAVVTDFGIAKAVSGTKLTGTGMSIGTPHYMSPEQARAQPLDGRSDIYSLGVVAYQCLTGSVPFDGEDSFSIGYKHVNEDVPVPTLKTAEQRSLFEIVRRMMAKVPADRFQDADHLARVLEGQSTLPSEPVTSAPTVAMKATPTSLSQVTRTTSTTPTTPMPRTDLRPPIRKVQKSRSGALVGLFLLLAGGGAGAGGWYYYTNYMQVRLQPPAGPDTVAVAAKPADSTMVPDSSTHAPSDSAASAPAARPAGPLPATGTLVVTGLPAGGRVQVDGKVVDASAPVTVEPGSHRITAQAVGYEGFSTTTVVSRGVEAPVTISMVRAKPAAARAPAGQCDTPGDTYNINGMCFDDRPVANSAPLVPIGDEITGNPKPSIVLVLVGPDGTVQRVTSKQISDNTTFHLQALSFAKTLTFRPAQKDGQPVKAWLEIMLLPTRSH